MRLSIKLSEQSVTSGKSPETVDDDGWRTLSDDLKRSLLNNKLQYINCLLTRARSRGLKIDSFYITDTEERIYYHHHKRVKLRYELLKELAEHKSDFSYGVFSSFYESSKYSIDSFFVLRFKKKLKVFFHVITEYMKENGFNVWMFDYNGNPYIIFDAREYGVECFFSEGAKRSIPSQRKILFQLDYFTNGPWCWVDMDDETIADVVKLRASIELEIHQKMMRPKRGKQALFWKHVFCMVRKCLKKS